MVAMVIIFPSLVLSGLDKASTVDPNTIQIEIPPAETGGADQQSPTDDNQSDDDQTDSNGDQTDDNPPPK